MFLIFMYITENAFKMATVVETQSDALVALRAENAQLTLTVDRNASLEVVANEQIELQKQLIRHYATKINGLTEDQQRLHVIIAEKDTLLATLQVNTEPVTVEVVSNKPHTHRDSSQVNMWLDAIRDRESERE